MLGTFIHAPSVIVAPSTPHTKGKITTFPKPAPFDFFSCPNH